MNPSTRREQHTTAEETQRTARRDSLRNLLARLDRHQLHGDEIALLRQHVETEIREADTARAVARANMRHVQTIVPDIDRLAAELEDAEQRATEFLAERDRAQAALDRVRDVADLIDAGAPWTASSSDTAARIRDAATDTRPAAAVTEGAEPGLIGDDGHLVCTCTYGQTCPLCRD